MKGIAFAITCIFALSAKAGFKYNSAVQKHKSVSALAVIESLILENCIPAKTLDFYGTLLTVENQHNNKGIAHTIHYDLLFPEKNVSSALVVQSFWPDNHGGIGKPFTVLTDKFDLCR